jgi:tetratricopeptide (TPR) repeat protein
VKLRRIYLLSWIRGTQALAAVFRNHPRAAIEFAQAGQSVAHERSIMKVRLLAQEARAHARLGERKLAEKCMAVVERSFNDIDEPLTTSILSFDRPYLPYYAGTCYSWLGKPNLAAKCSREAIALCDRAPDNWSVARVFARIDLAEALVQQNCLDEAVELAHECLNICVYGRRTAPMQSRPRYLLANLNATMGFSQTHDLAEKFHTIFRDGMS